MFWFLPMAQRWYLAIGFLCFFTFLSHPAYGRNLQEDEGLKIDKNTSTSNLNSLGLGRDKWFTNLDGKAGFTESTAIHHSAILTTQPSGARSYYGVKATLNVYGLPSITKGKGSSAQIWVAQEHEAEGMQAGWHVMPELYGDHDTHFYVYSLTNRWQSGCYNFQCDGFVRDNTSSIVPGYILRPLSKYNGDQYDITLKIRKNPQTGNWELTGGRNADKLIGYWPGHLFKSLRFTANRIDIGGTVFFQEGDLSPPMGSGHFAAEGGKKAAYIKNIQFVNEDGSLYTPGDDAFYLGQDKPDCYTITGSPTGIVYYGGPGNCKN